MVEEYQAEATENVQEAEEKMVMAFNHFDTENLGRIHVNDLRDALLFIGEQVTHK